MTRAPLAHARAPRTLPPLKTTARLIPLAFLLASCTHILARSAAPRAESRQPDAPPVRLNVIVTDESGRAAADVKAEEIAVREDGTPQKIIGFAREELPVSYGLVIDNSGSVRTLLDHLRRAAAAVALGNRPGDETFVARFAGSESAEVLQDFTSDPNELAKALMSLRVSQGQTAVIDAAYLAVGKAAARRAGEASRRRAVVLISDCEDRSSYYKREELVKLLRRESVQVFVVAPLDQVNDERGFIRKSPKEQARQLAELIAAESGGRAFFPKDVDGLIKAADEISRDLRAQYVLTYAPTNAKADGKFRKVEIRIADAPDRPKRRAVARPGYFAPK